jgi:hypothetical protein
MNWKHLFCDHIWKETDREFIRCREATGFELFRRNVFAVYQTCLRCDAKRIIEEHILK